MDASIIIKGYLGLAVAGARDMPSNTYSSITLKTKPQMRSSRYVERL